MKYYLVDINADVSAYKSQIVYKWQRGRQFMPSSFSLEKARLCHDEVNSITYKHLVTGISSEDLIMLTLRGEVSWCCDAACMHDAIALSENII